MISYLLSLLLQKRLYQHYGKWQVWMELLFLFFFLSICFFLSILYYRSPVMNGDMSIPAFLQQQYIPIAIIISPLLLILRWVTGRYFLRKQASQTAPQLVRTHRSYLINPRHFEHWVGNKEISVAGRKVPVSKTYKARLKEVLSSTTNN